ncbi:MAG: hypothetical protein KIS96_12735 [Bauldia sp.]|nr:hypothetical protein [Bauldia sp.]
MAKPKDREAGKKAEDITEANLQIARAEENTAIDGAEAALERGLTGARAGAMPLPSPARREGLDDDAPSLAEEVDPELREKRRA